MRKLQFHDLVIPRSGSDAEQPVRTEGGNHSTAPLRVANRAMMLERIAGAIGCREHLDPEPLEERARTELRATEPRGNLIVDRLRARAIELLTHTEHVVKLVIEPNPRRRAPKQIVMLTERLPDSPWISLDGRSVAHRDAQRLHRDAARVEHAKDVVIGRDNQRRWLGKGRVVVEQARLDMTVRAHQWKRTDLLVETTRHASDRRIGIEEPIRVQHQSLDRAGTPHRAKSR